MDLKTEGAACKRVTGSPYQYHIGWTPILSLILLSWDSPLAVNGTVVPICYQMSGR
jgi:hypothetical protein